MSLASASAKPREQGQDVLDEGDSVASLVQTIMTSKTEQKLLRMNKSMLHKRVLDLNDQVAHEAAEAIRNLIARVSKCDPSKVVVNWRDERPMEEEIEMQEDGTLLVSTSLMNKVAIEVS